MPDRVAAFAIRLEGASQALRQMSEKREAVLGAMYDSLTVGSIRLRGAIISSFGQAGYPRRDTGRLSRGIRSESERSEIGARAVVGVESKVPYARILEFGGVQPARTIRPKRKRALRWTTGLTRLTGLVGLQTGVTSRQAFAAPRSKKGRAQEAGDTRFARSVFQPARYQRAIPYFGPNFDRERPRIESDLRKRIAAALKG